MNCGIRPVDIKRIYRKPLRMNQRRGYRYDCVSSVNAPAGAVCAMLARRGATLVRSTLMESLAFGFSPWQERGT